jgi:2-methylcitrate dehydratase PrpD
MAVIATDSATFTHALAERSCALRYGDVPDDVLEIARQCVLDWFGVTLGGSAEDAPRVLLEVLGGDGESDRGAATVVGHRARLAPLEAALVNGTSSHVLDFDDVNIALLGHVSISVLAAALALAEQLDASVCELLTAFVAGYETACRIAVALGPEPYLRGYHATGTIGTFGATAACARLLGLDAKRTALATGIAASEAAGLKCNFGTMTKSLHAGKACENGLLAAQLAARGYTANPSAIEADRGFAAVVGGGCDAAAALTDPASGWHLRENIFKYHASCFFTHSMIEGLRDVMGSSPPPLAEIEQICVHVSELELGTCVIPTPSTGLEVKFSLAHLAAMTLLGRTTSTITDADARDEEAIAQRSKVVLVEDGLARRATRVEVRLRGGEVMSACHDVNTPASDLADQRRRLAGKFIPLARGALGSSGAPRLLEALSRLDASGSVRALMALARP